MPGGKAGTRPDLPLDPGGERQRNPSWNDGALTGKNLHRRVGRDRGEKIEPRGKLSLIIRQRQAAPVWQPQDPDLDFFHARFSDSAWAMRATSACATASLLWGGHDSQPFLLTR